MSYARQVSFDITPEGRHNGPRAPLSTENFGQQEETQGTMTTYNSVQRVYDGSSPATITIGVALADGAEVIMSPGILPT